MKTILEEVIEGLTIIKSVEPDAYFAAEHDEIFCGTVNKFNDEQKKQLEELGWKECNFGAFRRYV